MLIQICAGFLYAGEFGFHLPINSMLSMLVDSMLLFCFPLESHLLEKILRLFRNFKDKLRKQSKKDEMKWRILVRKILRAKGIGRAPFFYTAIAGF